MLFRPCCMFCTVTLALLAVCVHCPNMAVCCSSLISCFPVTLLRYCLSDFEMVPVAHIITGDSWDGPSRPYYYRRFLRWSQSPLLLPVIFEMVPVAPIITGNFWGGPSRPYYYRWFLRWSQSPLLLPVIFEMAPVAPIITGIPFAVTCPIRWISVMWSLYFKIFLASLFMTLLSPGTAASINVHCLLSRITLSGLLLGIVLSVRTCWFRTTVTLPSWLVSNDFGTWSYQCLLSNFTAISLHLLLLLLSSSS